MEYYAWTLTISTLKMRKSLDRMCSNRNTKLNSLKAHILFLMIWYFTFFWVWIFWEIYWQPYCQICDGQQPNLKVLDATTLMAAAAPLRSRNDQCMSCWWRQLWRETANETRSSWFAPHTYLSQVKTKLGVKFGPKSLESYKSQCHNDHLRVANKRFPDCWQGEPPCRSLRIV